MSEAVTTSAANPMKAEEASGTREIGRRQYKVACLPEPVTFFRDEDGQLWWQSGETAPEGYNEVKGSA